MYIYTKQSVTNLVVTQKSDFTRVHTYIINIHLLNLLITGIPL